MGFFACGQDRCTFQEDFLSYVDNIAGSARVKPGTT